jgi:hypothetical protein
MIRRLCFKAFKQLPLKRAKSIYSKRFTVECFFSVKLNDVRFQKDDQISWSLLIKLQISFYLQIYESFQGSLIAVYNF